MDWERARQPEQKAVRRKAILDAARSLFTELGYDEISLNGIAREAGMNKANVYRYFSSREEIFLTIYEAEQDQFIRSLIARLKKIRAKDTVRAICRAWVEVAMEHQALLDLLPQLSTSMEKNSSVGQLVGFKKLMFDRVGELLQTLERVYPQLNLEQWAVVVQCAVSMMAGKSGSFASTPPATTIMPTGTGEGVLSRPRSIASCCSPCSSPCPRCRASIQTGRPVKSG